MWGHLILSSAFIALLRRKCVGKILFLGNFYKFILSAFHAFGPFG
jgi:hypothetical protein